MAFMRTQAACNGVGLAKSNDTLAFEGNDYFPHNALTMEFILPSSTKTLCPSKGVASYYTVTVNGQINLDAAWYYPHPWPLVRNIKDRVAFWHGVQVIAEEPTGHTRAGDD